MNAKRCLSAFLLCLAGTAAAGAADAITPAGVFAKLDADQDGRISKIEAQSSKELTAAFARLDANHDGYLTITEFGQWEDAGKIDLGAMRDPSTAPSGSSGAQHMPKPD